MTSTNFRKYINPAVLSVIVIFLLFVFQLIQHRNNNPDKNSNEEFSTEIFKTENNGFGYQIKLNDEVIIKQEIIPAISMKAPFKTEANARNTAKLVVQKIKNKKVPSVTLHELDSMHIKY